MPHVNFITCRVPLDRTGNTTAHAGKMRRGAEILIRFSAIGYDRVSPSHNDVHERNFSHCSDERRNIFPTTRSGGLAFPEAGWTRVGTSQRTRRQ
jgi:hypothetical protein